MASKLCFQSLGFTLNAIAADVASLTYILLQPVTEADDNLVPVDVLYLGFSWKKVVLVSVPPNIRSYFLACDHAAFS